MIYKIKNVFLVFISFFLISCKKELKNDISFINNLSNETEYDLPFINESLIIFVKGGDRIFVTSIRKLFEEYSDNYSKKYSFDDFLVRVINDSMFDKEQMKNVSVHEFKVDNNIVNLYEKKGLNYLITEYCQKTNKKSTLFLKQNLNVEVQFNIMYYFFKNNYYLVEDDYEGRYILINKN